MKRHLILSAFLTASCFTPLLEAEEVIKDKSPAGKFALRMTHGKEGWDTAIIDAKTKKKIIDIENVAVSGDKERTDWMVKPSRSLEDYAKDATLVWSKDSQRVAYFNEDRDEHTASVYLRNGDTFEEVALPELPRCDEIKGEDSKYLSTVWYKWTPKYWLEGEDYKKPGVSGWFAYYNTKTRKFQLTDRFRAANKGARKRWRADDWGAFLPPSAESIGHEGPDATAAERLKKYETELAAMVKRREAQLEGADRAEFEKNEKEWREELEKKVARIKDAQTKLGLRARSTWYHLDDVRQYWLPVYEEAKSGDAKPSPP